MKMNNNSEIDKILKKQLRLGHEYPDSISYNTATDAMIEYGLYQFNEAVKSIQKEYETNKDFNITSILKYLK